MRSLHDFLHAVTAKGSIKVSALEAFVWPFQLYLILGPRLNFVYFLNSNKHVVKVTRNLQTQVC